MNGPEHFREAERLLSASTFTVSRLNATPVDKDGREMRRDDRDALIKQARVHAALAQVAATIDTAYEPYSAEDWARAQTGENPADADRGDEPG